MQYPNFVDNDTYFRLDRSASEHEQLTAMTNNLKTVHNLTTRHFDDFDELIAAYLRAGIEIFQMQTGIVSHITEAKQYIIKDVITPLVEVLHKDDVFELDGTYCREVANSGRTLGFPHVGEMDALRSHPVYRNLKLESYISAPIYVRDTLYGTLNFTSTAPREFGFSEMEHDLISMLANSIGNFILLQEKEQSLISLNNRLKEMVGFVAHDLRNPIGNITMATDMIANFKLEGGKLQKVLGTIGLSAQRALELINTILDAAAIGTGKITLNRSAFPLTQLVEETLEDCALLAQQRGITFEIDVPDTITVYGDAPRLRQVLNNLLTNALKYAPEDSAITLEGGPGDDNCTLVTITNDVADAPVDTLDNTIYQSVGFGLAIVHDILKLHESELAVETSMGHHTVAFCLPLENG